MQSKSIELYCFDFYNCTTFFIYNCKEANNYVLLNCLSWVNDSWSAACISILFAIKTEINIMFCCHLRLAVELIHWFLLKTLRIFKRRMVNHGLNNFQVIVCGSYNAWMTLDLCFSWTQTSFRKPNKMKQLKFIWV